MVEKDWKILETILDLKTVKIILDSSEVQAGDPDTGFEHGIGVESKKINQDIKKKLIDAGYAKQTRIQPWNSRTEILLIFEDAIPLVERLERHYEIVESLDYIKNK